MIKHNDLFCGSYSYLDAVWQTVTFLPQRATPSIGVKENESPT